MKIIAKNWPIVLSIITFIAFFVVGMQSQIRTLAAESDDKDKRIDKLEEMYAKNLETLNTIQIDIAKIKTTLEIKLPN